MADLVLHLKKEYFEQIAEGEKLEEYRLVTPYWIKRLEGRKYERVVLLRGYPKAGDESGRIVRRWRGYQRKTIRHPHFGKLPVEVFAIDVME
ncbi:ASCH domain-containing protein [Gammaproteobacteria bacterium]